IDKEQGRLSSDAKSDADAYHKSFVDILEFFGLMNTAFNGISKVGPAGFRPLVQALSDFASALPENR
ncbi:MAG: hypothetical protein Q7R41_07875, partial [Phycisphaerales bacterium]|nr:hypothetical protein [Phycisphaerales bacterium]